MDLNILDALTKNYLGTPKEIHQATQLNILKKDRPNGYKPVTTTLKLQREKYCTKIIIKILRNHLIEKKKIRLGLKMIEKLSIEDFTIYDTPTKRN